MINAHNPIRTILFRYLYQQYAFNTLSNNREPCETRSNRAATETLLKTFSTDPVYFELVAHHRYTGIYIYIYIIDHHSPSKEFN